MGKLATYLSILVFIDVLFLITGQLDLSSATSIVTGAILDPSAIKTSVFFLTFLGTAGIAALAVGSKSSVGLTAQATNVLAFTLLSISLIGLLGDFITIYNTLKISNEVLAVVVMAPIIILFSMTIVEWLRGKD